MPLPSNRNPSGIRSAIGEEAAFSEVVRLIAASRQKTFQSVNTALINLYWEVGATISRKIEAAEWGDGVVDRLAQFIAGQEPGLRGFTRRNLFRMRQFYEAYRGNAIVSALLTQLPWTHHLMILNQSKHPEEREFYLRMAIQERWSSRQLERQFKTALFERVILSPAKVSAPLTQTRSEAEGVFRDAYVLEFLGLPQIHAEADLHRGLLDELRDFLIELGRDFCFVGSEYPLQVGGRDFALDLLFFHRGRDVRKSHEQPAIGVLLCASKDDEVVEYALSRSLSPALIAEYQTQLPDKKLLQAKLHEFYLQNSPDGA